MGGSDPRAEPDPVNDKTARAARFRVERHREGLSVVLGRPGSDLLSQVLRHSIIGAEEFNGRVRDGIGFRLLATATRPAKDNGSKLVLISLIRR